ncbi:MAG: esterase-like activity of phytase family protein [Planktomarina sp.]
MRWLGRAIAVASLWAAPAVAQLTHLQTYIWDGEHPKVRGISGFELSADGLSYTAVSDFGELLTGTVIRQNDAITAMPVSQTGRIQARSGRSTRGPERDAEGLAVLPDGSVSISFERVQRVASFPDPFGPARNLGNLSGTQGLVGNKGLEALAVDANSVHYAIPESPHHGKHAILKFQSGQWTIAMVVPNTDSFLTVGADFAPDGTLWILERKFFPPFFGSRIKVLDLETATATIIWQSTLGTYDNLEAITLWTDGQNRQRVTLVADDNDNWYQSTQVVEFYLQDE